MSQELIDLSSDTDNSESEINNFLNHGLSPTNSDNSFVNRENLYPAVSEHSDSEQSILSMDNSDINPNHQNDIEANYNRIEMQTQSFARVPYQMIPVADASHFNRIELDDNDIVQVDVPRRGGVPIIASPDRTILIDSTLESSMTSNRIRIISTEDQTHLSTVSRKRPSDDIQPSTSHSALDETTEDGDMTCTICFEEYTSAGDHRLVCLKCGHLFGQKCIEKWIRSEKNAKCPQCQTRAKIGDIRMIDNYEVERLKIQNTNLKMEKDSLSLQVRRIEEKMKELEKVAKQAEQTITGAHSAALLPVGQPLLENRYFKLVRSFDPVIVSEPSGARCMDYHKDLGLIIACRIHNTGLTSGLTFGLRKLAIETDLFHSRTLVPCHRNRIRFCAISPFNPMLVLSTGEDKYMCITSFAANQMKVVKTLELPSLGWSCAWINQDLVVAGLRSVVQFRWSTDEPMKHLMERSGRGPISKLEWVPDKNYLFIVSLKECLVLRYGVKTLLFSDAIQSFAYDAVSDNFCVTVTPPTNGDNEILTSFMDHQNKLVPQHILRHLNLDNGGPVCLKIDAFKSRSHSYSRLVQNFLYSTSNLSDPMMFFYSDEEHCQVVVQDWRKRRSTLTYGIPENEKIQQIKVIPVPQEPKNKESGLPTYLYIFALADTKLFISKLEY